MPDCPRNLILEDQSYFHVTWLCHNKDWFLKDDAFKQVYYNLLLRFNDRYHVKIFSYCFMSNHPHLTGYCETQKELSDFFRIVNSLFAKAINYQFSRRGQVVMDRFKSPMIETENDLEKVMYYIDLNPKRAGMVRHPKNYKWSSFHYYAYGKDDPLITPAPCYQNMGLTKKARQQVYLEMVEEILKDDWKQKRQYSSTHAIGNPMWVKKRFEGIKKNRTETFKKWRKRFKEKFHKLAS